MMPSADEFKASLNTFLSNMTDVEIMSEVIDSPIPDRRDFSRGT
jgi:hypothetical protein